MKWNDKSVLVTGANGFMGTQVVKELEKRNPREKILTQYILFRNP